MENIPIQPEDGESLHKLYRDITPTAHAVNKLVAENTVTFELDDDRRFRSVVFEPEEHDGSVIFALGEIGNGVDHVGGAVRALGVRALANPHATIIWQPNETILQSNVNASWGEKIAIARGDYSAFSRRFNKILDVLAQERGINRDLPALLHGPSQGGALAPKITPDLDLERIAVAAIEAPNVVERGILELANDFRNSGKDLEDVIRRNYPENDENITIGQDILDDFTLRGFMKFSAGLAIPTNVALGLSMTKPTFREDIINVVERGIDKGSVFHVWGDKESLSPNDPNAEIAAEMVKYDNYGFMVFEGGHAGTNINLVAATAGRQALRLLNVTQ